MVRIQRLRRVQPECPVHLSLPWGRQQFAKQNLYSMDDLAKLPPSQSAYPAEALEVCGYGRCRVTLQRQA